MVTVKITIVYNSFSFHQTVCLTGSYSCVAFLIVGFMLYMSCWKLLLKRDQKQKVSTFHKRVVQAFDGRCIQKSMFIAVFIFKLFY